MSKKNKNYKVIVEGQREVKAVSFVEPVTYHLSAENGEQAMVTAREKFEADYPDVIKVKATVKNRGQSIVSIVCLAFACFLSLIPWYQPDGSMVSLNPVSLMPFLFSIAIYCGVIIRSKGITKGLRNAFLNGIPEAIGNILIIFFVASFVRLLSDDAHIQVFNFSLPIGRPLSFTLAISGRHLLILGLLFSWLGIAKVAKFVWIAFLFLAAFRLQPADLAMGRWGMVYILSAFLGIVFHIMDDSFLQIPDFDFLKRQGKTP